MEGIRSGRRRQRGRWNRPQVEGGDGGVDGVSTRPEAVTALPMQPLYEQTNDFVPKSSQHHP